MKHLLTISLLTLGVATCGAYAQTPRPPAPAANAHPVDETVLDPVEQGGAKKPAGGAMAPAAKDNATGAPAQNRLGAEEKQDKFGADNDPDMRPPEAKDAHPPATKK